MNISELRAEALKKQKLVGSKISRIKRNQGVSVGGTEFDPRVPADRIRRLNRKQLTAFISRADQFNSRPTKFVGGLDGAPIPHAQWERYKSLERRFNIKSQNHLESIGNTEIPGLGVTIAERERDIKANFSSRLRAGGDAANKPFYENERSVENMVGSSAIDKLIQSMDRKLGGGYFASEMGLGRSSATGLLDAIGSSDLNKRLLALSDDQFNRLWNYSNFADAAKLVYENEKASNGASSDVVSGQREDIEELLSWAEASPWKSNSSG